MLPSSARYSECDLPERGILQSVQTNGKVLLQRVLSSCIAVPGAERVHRLFAGNLRPVAWRRIWLLGLMFGSALSLTAQQPAGVASQSQEDKVAEANKSAPATFIGYATNGSVFFPDIATSAGPLSTSGKFKLFVNQSISPPYILVAASSAAFDQATDSPKGYGQGWAAYGGRFGMNIGRASSSSFFGTFLFASLLHEDPRFFPQSKPSFWGSLKYSARQVVITRKDSGREVLNTSGLLGPLASEGLANVYLPSSERTAGNTMARFAEDLAWRVAGNMFKNYWPTLFHSMGLNRLKVIPDPGTPGVPEK
jgi:hypothetical protein